MSGLAWDSLGKGGFFYCDCGAVTPFLLIDGKKFFLGSYRNHIMKYETGGMRKVDCLWCGESYESRRKSPDANEPRKPGER